MPLILDDTQPVPVNVVRITTFNCVVDPMTVSVSYVQGYEDVDGFHVIKEGAAVFNQEQVETVDPTGAIYNSMKDALYELLETRLGPGTIE